MSGNYRYSFNYDDPLIAELYDRSEIYTDDIKLIRKLIGKRKALRILEPFSGTGRIVVPLAKDGHFITGIEISGMMTARAALKAASLSDEVASRISLRVEDALDGGWGNGYDLVILGANCFYELPDPVLQEKCIQLAFNSLNPGGCIFIDNDDYKGDWNKGPFGKELSILAGKDRHGTYGRASMEHVGFDENTNTLEMKRRWYTRTRDGIEEAVEYVTRKHPVTAAEVESWLVGNGFEIVGRFGDRQGNEHTETSERAIFWARKQ